MLKAKLESLDGIDESIRSFYEETDDGYQLKVEGLEDTGALKRAKDHEKRARKEAEARMKSLQEELDALTAQRQQDHDDSARKKGDVEALEKSWQQKYAKRESELTEQIQALSGNLTGLLVDSRAEALAAELAVPGSASVLIPHIRSRLAAEQRDGKYTTVVLDKDGQPSALSLDELKAELAGDEAFAPLIAGSKASGSGATPSGRGGSAANRGNLGGSRDERVAALKSKFPELS